MSERMELAECVWCTSITVEPQTDICACGEELYPISKAVEPGTRIRNSQLDDVELPLETK